jgi:F-type H+-transporting ATPase subunit delta
MAAFAARYARAFADVVEESHLPLEEVKQQLDDFMSAWHAAADLREVFLDPSFPVEEKVAILDRMNQKMGLAQPVRNFLAVVLQHERMHAIEEILKEFREEMNRRLGITAVSITSARPLNEEQRKALVEQVSTLTKNRIEPSFHEDASLLGGVVVQVGSKVYDGSVRGRFARLEEQLAVR